MFNIISFHEIVHGIAATPPAYYLWKKTKELKYFFIVLLTTYLLDADHLVDYFLYFGAKFNIKDFFLYDYYFKPSALIPLHGWEYMAVMLALYNYKYKNNYLLSIIFGYSMHMVIDAINIGSVIHYFLFYRLVNNLVFT